MKKQGQVLEINPKDNKSLPYWTEEETMDFLKLSVNSFRKLVTKRKLTRYEIGHRYFYDQIINYCFLLY